MKHLTTTAAVTALLALTASPAFAQKPAGTPDRSDNPGSSHRQADKPEESPGQSPDQSSNPGTDRKLGAPGRFCKDASKKRVEGEKGTAFSACVKAQARLRSGKADSPREACKGASKKHVKGEKGTAFSTCVKAAAKLLKAQKEQEEPAAPAETPQP